MLRNTTFIGLTIALTMCACGVRESTAPDGSTSREVFVGAVQQLDCSTQQGHSARTLQIGAWISTTDAGAGFRRAKYFCGAPHCQLTLWADGLNRSELEEIAAKYHGICIANKEGD